jgi:hypothetical protein
MEANKAPEKIYMTPCFGEPNNVLLASFSKSHLNFHKDIEYTRTDAFIEKALKWYCLDCECNDSCKADHKCFIKQEFKRYLEGNDYALPPKLENAINPDGSTTDNYRYRHFIRKTQDIFIEKACEFLKSYRQDTYDGMGYIAGIINDKTIDDFVNYMKGE